MKLLYLFLFLFLFYKKSKSLNTLNNFNDNNKQILSIKIKNSKLINLKNDIIPKKKNLLIGAFANYKWKEIALYFKSFEKAGFDNSDFIMFVSNITKETINNIESCGFKVYQIPDDLKNLPIMNIRWKIYEDYLNNNANKYNLIFTADVRDVFFQQDIFKNIEQKESYLAVALEDGNLNEQNNKKWIIDAYGEELYNTIKDERIICTGAIWGKVDKFKEFSHIMWEKLNSEWAKEKKVKEQAVANFIVYHDKMFSDCLVKSDNYGPVMSLSLTNRNNISLDEKNNILNFRGEIASVIYQYQGKTDLFEKVKNKYYPDLDK